MRWERKPGAKAPRARRSESANALTTSLWPQRWPAIALQVCIDEVQAAPPEDRQKVKNALPCKTCEMNTACLNAKRKELGPLLYDREILTHPRSSESSLFPAEVFEPMKVATPCVPRWSPPFSLEHEWRVIQSWDLAWSEKIGGDYLVCTTVALHLPSGLRRLLDIERWQRIPFDDQIDLIEKQWRQFKSNVVVIETDAAQAIWKKRVQKETPVPVVGHDAGKKRDFVEGVPGLLIQFANEKWEIPWMPGTYHFEEVENLLNEFEAFGWNDGKLEGVGEHDDTVMSFWHASWMCEALLGNGTVSEEFIGVVQGARG